MATLPLGLADLQAFVLFWISENTKYQIHNAGELHQSKRILKLLKHIEKSNLSERGAFLYKPFI